MESEDVEQDGLSKLFGGAGVEVRNQVTYLRESA